MSATFVCLPLESKPLGVCSQPPTYLAPQVSANCHIVKPDPLQMSEVEYRNTVGQQGWCSLWSPLDDNGLGIPAPKKGWFGAGSQGNKHGSAKGADVDGDGVDDVRGQTHVFAIESTEIVLLKL